jgi:hypothetical protein
MLADLQSIKISVERSLPADVLAAMREAGIALTLDSSSGSQPVVRISDELAERCGGSSNSIIMCCLIIRITALTPKSCASG